LKAPDKARNLARHNDNLPVKDLLRITSKMLTEQGRAAFIIPADAFVNWTAIASGFALFPTFVTKVKSSPVHNPHRVMVIFTKEHKTHIPENELIIYSSKNIYSNEYRELTKKFYLNF
jgi:tRNA1Val (adenine37-N6)-methyltransferase